MSKLLDTISNLFRPTYSPKNNEDRIFNNIYGHEDIKQIIEMTLKAEQPVHVLLTGEPGCGKTQFLENIKGYYKEKAYFTIGAHSTKAGMMDYLFGMRPRILLIDEIEHMPAKDQVVLLSLMQSQILSETKYRKTRQTQLKCSILATSNSTKKMLDPLLSRFVMINVEKYSYEEFKEIAMKVITERENVEDENLAMTIIDEVWKNMGEDYANIRDIIKIARLAHNAHDVKLITRIMFGSRRNYEDDVVCYTERPKERSDRKKNLISFLWVVNNSNVLEDNHTSSKKFEHFQFKTIIGFLLIIMYGLFFWSVCSLFVVIP